ncbi:uncharacterized protein Z518_11065 [Rhinocladiella mackenziei CBS 650.93]|uniref:Uncharacterized protein n=1 Tax=Rhinocladiella mackenziei CBS 650.93 TaxID=1442369 RepID=A0A0D2GMR5_9EURO|nr:uncharacterized protein Z518_11065 [Rhinocladiella mackenziei CBS 650.93]KIW99652.1 hypothetical protein Z518_11065 [Rhinocladiella mackenziei CBS 650.93]
MQPNSKLEQLIYLYHSIRSGLHSDNQILRYESIVCSAWIVLKVLPFGLFKLFMRYNIYLFLGSNPFQVQIDLIMLFPTPRSFLRYTRSRKMEKCSEKVVPNPVCYNTFPSQEKTDEHSDKQLIQSLALDEPSVQFPASGLQQRMSSTSTDLVDNYHFCLVDGRYFYQIEDQIDLSSFRRRIPWSARYPPDKCSSEEFLLLSQDLPRGHSYLQGTPALYDTFRRIFREDLRNTIKNFATHRDACGGCSVGNCSELFRLMYMLLRDIVGTQITVCLNDRDFISHDGKNISWPLLASVQPRESSMVMLHFELDTRSELDSCSELDSGRITMEIGWADLWDINGLGIFVYPLNDLWSEIADILPGWSGSISSA